MKKEITSEDCRLIFVPAWLVYATLTVTSWAYLVLGFVHLFNLVEASVWWISLIASSVIGAGITTTFFFITKGEDDNDHVLGNRTWDESVFSSFLFFLDYSPFRFLIPYGGRISRWITRETERMFSRVGGI